MLISIAEGMIAFFTTISIPTGTDNPFMFGFSISRLLLLLIILVGIIGLLVVLIHHSRIISLITTRNNTEDFNKGVTTVAISAFIALWFLIFTPSKDFADFEGLFVRTRPILIWLCLVFLQTAIWIKLLNNSFRSPGKFPPNLIRSIATVFLPILVLWVVISTTKVGLVQETDYWNVPGIPISMMQLLGLGLFFTLGMIFFSEGKGSSRSSSRLLIILLPIGIYLVTVLVWGFTPLIKHYFSLIPTPPLFQPFPYSDARYNDTGGLTILLGKGIYNFDNTDKPLYMAFLAVLHLFAGNDYYLMQWAHVLVIGFTPVALFLLGKKYLGTLFGTLAAALLIFQQRNAIALSYKIASVNPKLLMSEMLVLLGLGLISWLLFEWMKSPEPKKVFLLGGLIGALSLVRVNPIFIAPVMLLIILIRYIKSPKLLGKQLVFFIVGFVLVFSPWLVTGVNSEGETWFLIKVRQVIKTRYKPNSGITPARDQAQEYVSISPAYLFTQTTKNQTSLSLEQAHISTQPAEENTNNLIWIMFNHFLHNISGSLLILPDNISLSSLNDLSAREYWQDNNRWDGTFPPGQHVLILVNLFVVSLGIVFAWKKHGWAGMSPLIIFMAYNLSLAAATNSGSRYIVPISWVVLFYFALGMFLITKFVLHLLAVNPSHGFAAEDIKPTNNSFKSWLPAVFILVILASILPIANLVVPKLIPSEQTSSRLTEYAQSINSADYQLIQGTMLYPYNSDMGEFSFVFLHNYKDLHYRLSRANILSPDDFFPESGVAALLTVKQDNKQMEVQSIFLERDETPYIFWQK